ncbi:MAG: TonB-dependent receptor [Pseudomonadota bacterium]
MTTYKIGLKTKITAGTALCLLFALGFATTVILDSKTALAQTEEAIAFDIPEGPLAKSLDQVAATADLTLSYNTSDIADTISLSLVGSFTVQEAIDQLLANTGLIADYVNVTSIAITQAEQEQDRSEILLAPITVEAVLGGTITQSYAAPDSFAATRTDRLAIETPQSTQSVTRQVLEDSGAKEVADAYDYLAGIVRENNTGGLFGDDYIARGFETDNILFNGNRTGQPTTLDIAAVERVEAVRGATTALFGRADPGGLVNVITKQPLAKPYNKTTITGTSGVFGDGSRLRGGRATIDVGGPLNESGRVRHRLNVATEYEQSFREDLEESLFFFSPVFDIDLSDRTVANVELTYQHRRAPFDRGVFFVEGELPLDRDFNIAEGQDNEVESRYAAGTFRLDHRFSDSLRGRIGFYTSFNDFEGDGAQVGSVIGTEASAIARSFDGDDLFVILQPEMIADFETGALSHTLLAGVDVSHQKNDIDELAFGAPSAPTDVFDPVFPLDIPPVDLSIPGASDFVQDSSATSVGVYLQDQVDLTDQLSLVAGLRWDSVWLESDTSIVFNVGAPEPFEQETDEDFSDSAFLPRIGLVYRPVEEVGLYASYAESYRPPVERGLTDSAGNEVEPETGRSYEVGAKLDAFDGRLAGTLAVFRADKKNVLESDPVDFTSQINLGRVRSQGVEFDIAGEPIEGLSIGVSYAFTEAEVRGDRSLTLPDGTRLRNVPRHTASLRTAYSFEEGPLNGLRIFGGLVYESDNLTDTSATITTELPSFVRADIGASYVLTENAELRFQIRNLTDEEYYPTAAGQNNVAVGEPFSASLGVTIRF